VLHACRSRAWRLRDVSRWNVTLYKGYADDIGALFLVNYARLKPDVALKACDAGEVCIPFFFWHGELHLRYETTRTPRPRSCPTNQCHTSTSENSSRPSVRPQRGSCETRTPYVRKTATFCAGETYDHDRNLVEQSI